MRWVTMRWMGAGHGAITDKGPWLAKVAAIGYLAGLVIIVATGWHDPGAAPGGLMAGLPAWHMAFLMATGTGVALLTLARNEPTVLEPAVAQDSAPTPGMRDLMDQLSHELRTPLNAVIGFSEVMLSELHGPLGNARYQEYAQHISESGGRLLKSSTEALAVTEAMTALMTDRSGAKRERMIAATLVREAWRVVAPEGETAARLMLVGCAACDITGERRPTVQALQHLLREAQEHAPSGSAVKVTGQRQGGRRRLEIAVEPAGADAGGQMVEAGAPAACPPDPRTSLRVILARLLLEMQGAKLTVTTDLLGSRSIVVEFAPLG